jgi:hypothetical protein
MQLCLPERMTVGARMFVHGRLTPNKPLAAIIVAKRASSQAGTALRGPSARKGHDKNRTEKMFFSYRRCYHLATRPDLEATA